MVINEVWEKVFSDYDIDSHDFTQSPFFISTRQIKDACQCLDSGSSDYSLSFSIHNGRDSRPDIFVKNDLFLLPVKSGERAIVRGEGYFDIPEINLTEDYKSRLDFKLESVGFGGSQIQYLDFAYASGLLCSFVEDNSLQLTLRGRYHLPQLEFNVANQTLNVKNAQINIDAGYEGRDKLVLVKIRNSSARNLPLRQLYYPFRYWKAQTSKEISLVLFEKRREHYFFWQYQFKSISDYNSLMLLKSSKCKLNIFSPYN